jgi:hypothetical protein
VVDAAVWVPIDNAGKDVGQTRKRVNGVQLAGFDQGRDSRPMLCTSVRVGEHYIFSIERIGRIDRLTKLLSSLMRPFSIKRVKLSIATMRSGWPSRVYFSG